MFEARNLNILNKANNLVFSYNLSFSIQSSEIWRFRGPNGIGKSSLYESLIGLRPIFEGEIYLDSVSLNNLSSTQRINLGLKYTPQKNAFFNDLSVFQNLSIFANYLTSNSANHNDILDNAIETFQLNEFVHKIPSQLSGGQQRLSELSKIMIGPCKLALIDEPFAALDSNTIQHVCNIFLQLKEQGLSFFINDHNLKALESIADYDLALTKSTVKIASLKK